MFGKYYVLFDGTPCCFSEATLGEFLQHWEAPRPCHYMPNFIVVAATTVECAGPQQHTVESVCTLRGSQVKSCYSSCLSLNVMLLLNMMLYWTGSGRTPLS